MAGRFTTAVRRVDTDADRDGEALARLALDLAGKGLHDRRILAAVEMVPRPLFLPAAFQDRALIDRPVPIECGQTADAPSTLCRIYQAADISAEHRVLEVGTGSGWGTAILAGISAKVYTIERFRTLGELAHERFAALHLGNIVASIHDGLDGFARHAPFHRIVLDGSLESVPRGLLEQLAPQGILIAAVGPEGHTQMLTRFVRTDRGFEAEPVLPIRRVALVRGRAAAL